MSEGAALLQLRITEPGRPMRVVEVRHAIVCGRSRRCDVVIEDETVSREHLRIGVDGASVFVEDLGSNGGTFVDGRRLARGERCRIAARASIHAGGTVLEIERAPERAPAAGGAVPPPPAPAKARPASQPSDQTQYSARPGPVPRARRREPDRTQPSPVPAPAPNAGPPQGGGQTRRVGARPDPGESPADDTAVDVMLGAAAPRAVAPGGEFTARFVAHLPRDEANVARLLAKLSPRSTPSLGVQRCRWRNGTEAVVVCRAQGLAIDPPAGQRFVWNGDPVLLDFDAAVPAAATGTVVLKFDVLIADVRIATIRLDLHIAAAAAAGELEQAKVTPARTAFASYASEDRQRVLDRVASVRTATGLDVFLDCLTLRSGARVRDELRAQILARDLFLLFWSRAASASEWVAFEVDTALAAKPEDALQVHTLVPFGEAQVPERLRHLHFGDVLMDLRRGGS